MKHQTMTASQHTGVIATIVSKPLQLISAFLLGTVILYGAVMVQSPTVHSAAHDMRHSAGFPCH